jgi:putative transcriptional regulator
MSDSSYRSQFLIALPTLGGDYFSDAVILLIDHTDEGAFGLVVNKPTDIASNDLLDGNDARDFPVMSGGPVSPGRLFFIHEPSIDESSYEAMMTVTDGVCLTTSADLIAELEQGVGPDKIMALLGYAGWGAGQLEQEMADDVWLMAPASANVVFDVPCDDRPLSAARNLGIDLNLLLHTQSDSQSS